MRRIRRLVADAERQLRAENLRVLARQRVDAAAAHTEQLAEQHARTLAAREVRRATEEALGPHLKALRGIHGRRTLRELVTRLDRLVTKRAAPAVVRKVATKVVRTIGRLLEYAGPEELPDFEWLPGTPESVRAEIREKWRTLAERLERDRANEP